MAGSTLDWLTVRLRLQNQAQFNRELATSAGGVKTFGREVEVAGKKSAFAAEKNFLLGESLYSLRRYGFYAITALGLTGAEVLKMGLSFDSAKQDAIDSFTVITGSAREARREVKSLIDITHTSGLGLGFLADEAKNMRAFGYSARDTNRYLKDFANFAGKKGLGQGGVQSLVSIFNRVRDTGAFTSRDARSLQGLGIPVNQQFAKAFNLSPAQLFALQHGQLQLSGASALPALDKYIGGYANRQPYRLGQLFSILKGDIGEELGGAESGIFSGLRTRLTAGVRGYNKGGFNGLLGGIDPSGGLRTFFSAVANTAKVVAQTLHAIWVVGRPLVYLFGGLVHVAGFLTGNLTAMKLILKPLIGLYILDRAQKVIELAKNKLLIDTSVTTTGTLVELRAAAGGAAVALERMALLGPNSTTTKTGSLLATAEGAATGGAVAGAAWKTRGLGFLQKAKLLGKRLPGLAFLLGGTSILTDRRMNNNVLDGKNWRYFGQDIGIPGLAAGGDVTRSGWSLVGEKGPELRYMRKGASVVPLNRAGLNGGGGIDYGRLARAIVEALRHSPFVLVADGHEIAELVTGTRIAIGARQ